MNYIIQQDRGDVMEPQPWPLLIDDEGVVLSGLGPDDGARLVGFQNGEEQRVTLFFDQWTSGDLEAVVGMAPVFARAGNVFAMLAPIVAVGSR